MKHVINNLNFIWDQHNINKNLIKHKVSFKEAEEIFIDEKRKILNDKLHSNNEVRFIIIGKTKKKRMLFAVFTFRKSYIRIISIRDLNKKEKYLYEKNT